jgi:predicted acetyltransferase
MVIFRLLDASDEARLRRAVREFAASDPNWEFAFDFDEASDFTTYLARLERERRGIDVPEGWVPHSFLVALVGDDIVGRLSLRHTLNPFLLGYGGHIGFGVVPSARRRGYGRTMLGLALPMASALGIDRVLLTCDDRNVGSIRIIESCGGVLEDARPRAGGGQTRRYWIDLAPSRRR